MGLPPLEPESSASAIPPLALAVTNIIIKYGLIKAFRAYFYYAKYIFLANISQICPTYPRQNLKKGVHYLVHPGTLPGRNNQRFFHSDKGVILQSRASPEYFGYVIASDMKGNQLVWTVKVQGPEGNPNVGLKANVDLRHVPENIGPGMDAVFDLVSAGKQGGLVAINATLTVRPRQLGTTEKR